MKLKQIFWFFGLLLPMCGFAQPYSVNWFTVAGGGGTSTGATYQVSGTIGQHDAGGPMTGNGYSLAGGFWNLVALQTPGAPLLGIQLTGTNTVLVSWPASAPGFTLQENSLAHTTNWVNVGGSADLVDGRYQVIIAPPTGNRFYRLRSP